MRDARTGHESPQIESRREYQEDHVTQEDELDKRQRWQSERNTAERLEQMMAEQKAIKTARQSTA